MTRLDYGAAIPGARVRFAQAGSRMAIDSGPIDIRADGDEPVVIDFSGTDVLQVLAAALRENDLLGEFVLIATNPHGVRAQTEALPKLRAHERIQSALSLTWTVETARDVAGRLEQAADVAESEPDATLLDGTSDDADASDDLHLSGYQP